MKPPRTQETADVFGASTNDPVLPLDVLYIFLGHLIMLYIMTYFEDDFFARNKWGDNRHPSRRRLRRAHRDLSVFLGWRTYLIRRKKGASQTAQVERARGAFSTPWICSISKAALKIDLLVASRWAAPAAAQAESEIRSTLLQEKRFFFYNTSEASPFRGPAFHLHRNIRQQALNQAVALCYKRAIFFKIYCALGTPFPHFSDDLQIRKRKSL